MNKPKKILKINFSDMMLSINDKLNKAYDLACKVADSDEAIKNRLELDEIYVYVDGLKHKYFEERINGRCSIQASLNFDLEKEEKELDAFIVKCEKALNDKS